MINSSIHPVIIIHSILPQAWFKASEKRYITENINKPLPISMLTYNSDFSLHGISISYNLSNITLTTSEIDAEVKFV